MHSSKLERAKLFLSYDALKGFSEMIEETQRAKVPRKLLSEDDYAHLNHIWQNLSTGMFLKVTYYHIDHYTMVTGPLTRMETEIRPRLKIGEQWIKLADISHIEIL